MKTTFQIFALIFGILLFSTAVKETYLGFISGSWPSTTATIITTDWTISRHQGILPRLVFRYQINQTPYQSHNFAFDSESLHSLKEAKQISEQYAIGKEVLIRYNPQQLDMAVLQPGVKEEPLIQLFAGAIIVILISINLLKSLIRSHGS